MKKIRQHRWFSILMALGIISVLMVMVIGLAMMYVREFKLSRLSYDEILASTIAEWAFEYGMLKARNHEAGFSDELDSSLDVDGKILQLSTPRSAGLITQYKLYASGNQYKTELKQWESLVIPLFVDEWEFLEAGKKSKKPQLWTSQIKFTQWLQIANLSDKVEWAIVAENGNVEDFYNPTLSLRGNGSIDATTQWKIRLKTALCIYKEWNDFEKTEASDNQNKSCENILNFALATEKEEVQYDFDKEVNVEKFLADKDFGVIGAKAKNPYLLLTNTDINSVEVNIATNTDFTLPMRKITATAKKWNASQVFEFDENTSLYYQWLLTAYGN